VNGDNYIPPHRLIVNVQIMISIWFLLFKTVINIFICYTSLLTLVINCSFYPHHAMLERALDMALCLSVCLSQVRVLLKRLNQSRGFLARELPILLFISSLIATLHVYSVLSVINQHLYLLSELKPLIHYK